MRGVYQINLIIKLLKELQSRSQLYTFDKFNKYQKLKQTKMKTSGKKRGTQILL